MKLLCLFVPRSRDRQEGTVEFQHQLLLGANKAEYLGEVRAVVKFKLRLPTLSHAVSHEVSWPNSLNTSPVELPLIPAHAPSAPLSVEEAENGAECSTALVAGSFRALGLLQMM